MTDVLDNRPSMSLTQRILLGLMIGGSLLIAAHAYLFQFELSGGSDFHERFARLPLAAALHVLGAGTALLVGGFQFLPGFRSRHLTLHRWLGRLYLIAVLVGGIGGIWLATQAAGGLASRLGFGMLGVLWLISGWNAYSSIRRGDIRNHRLWMIRCFALTFAAVTLRIYLGLMTGPLGLDFDTAYSTVAWTCWVPNLVIAEWLIVTRPWSPVPQPG